MLRGPSLLKTDASLGGEWAKDAHRLDVIDPATRMMLPDVFKLGPIDPGRALPIADAAWPRMACHERQATPRDLAQVTPAPHGNSRGFGPQHDVRIHVARRCDEASQRRVVDRIGTPSARVPRRFHRR